MGRSFFPLLVIIVVLFTLNFGLGGCSESQSREEQSDIKVITTIFPLADIAQNIGGEKVEVSHLLPSGASPHTFEPTVEQMKKMSEADVFVYIGGGLDDWATSLKDAAPPDLEVVKSTSGIELKEAVNSHNGHCCAEENGDPHIWLDPLLMRDKVLPRLEDAFAQIAPEKRDYFQERQEEYARELTKTHAQIEERISGFSRKEFITIHSAWRYFADRYGLKEAGVITPYPGQEPSASRMKELVEIAKEIEAQVIFSEPQLNPEVAEQLAKEIDAEVFILDPLGGEDLEKRNSYLKLLLYNATTLGKALD